MKSFWLDERGSRGVRAVAMPPSGAEGGGLLLRGTEGKGQARL